MFPDDSPLMAALGPYGPAEQMQSNAVTFRFMPAGEIIEVGEPSLPTATSVTWSAEEMQFVRSAFDYIATFVNLTFTEVAAGNASASISLYEVPDLGESAGFVTYIEVGQAIAVIGSEYTGEITFDQDNTTVIHEIGHALGLAHPHDGPATLPGVTGQNDKGDLNLNTEFVTRMSYVPGESPLHPGVDIWGEGATLGALDIAVLQQLYGANTSTGLGDTTYGDTRRLETIWDNGGSDLIDFSNATENAVIDLRPATLMLDEGGGGYLSFIESQNGTVADGGYTIAYGVVIENASGGAGADRITGNDVDNLLLGNGGNDLIDGGAGMDTAIYSGARDSYTLTLSQAGTTVLDRRADGDGLDTLANVEAVFFDDAGGVFDLAVFGGTAGLDEAAMRSFIELYIAYFNRAPDAIGLNFWGTAFANGTSLSQMATYFIDQDETRATYSEGLSNADFATAVYANVLGRVADQDGYDFWVGVLDEGSVGRDQFILSVLDGAKAAPQPGASQEFIAQQAADRAYLSTKTDIGAYYAVTKGMSDVGNAVSAMELFTGSASSITAAQNAIDNYYISALDADNGAFLMPLVGVLDDPFAGVA